MEELEDFRSGHKRSSEPLKSVSWMVSGIAHFCAGRTTQGRHTFVMLILGLLLLASICGVQGEGMESVCAVDACTDACMTEWDCEVALVQLLESWGAAQSSGQSTKDERPMLIIRPRYGLGNRIMTVVSGLALALATNRRLVTVWGENFDNLFQPPSYGWGKPPTVKRGDEGGILMLDLTQHSKMFAQGAAAVACGEGGGLGQFRVVDIVSDQYFLPLVLLNENSPAALRGPPGAVSWADTVFKVLGRWFLRPSEDVQHAVSGFESVWGACAVGVHVRVPMYAWEEAQVPQVQSDVALKCAREVLRNAFSTAQNPAEIEEGSKNSRRSFQRNGDKEAQVVFLATTSDAVRGEAERALVGYRVSYTKGPTERMTDSGEGERQALMDLLLLSRCEAIVASVHSTFSYAAHALAGREPWVVSSASVQGQEHFKGKGQRMEVGSKDFEDDVDQGVSEGGVRRSVCRKSVDSGPCFHGWETVVSYLTCYDATRDVGYRVRPCW